MRGFLHIVPSLFALLPSPIRAVLGAVHFPECMADPVSFLPFVIRNTRSMGREAVKTMPAPTH